MAEPLTTRELRNVLGTIAAFRVALDALERIALVDDDAGKVALQAMRDMQDEINSA